MEQQPKQAISVDRTGYRVGISFARVAPWVKGFAHFLSNCHGSGQSEIELDVFTSSATSRDRSGDVTLLESEGEADKGENGQVNLWPVV